MTRYSKSSGTSSCLGSKGHQADTTRTLGTPDEESWPGVTSLPDYKSSFPQWSGTPLVECIRNMDADALDLLASMLVFDPAHRMSGESPHARPSGRDMRNEPVLVLTSSETGPSASILWGHGAVGTGPVRSFSLCPLHSLLGFIYLLVPSFHLRPISVSIPLAILS